MHELGEGGSGEERRESVVAIVPFLLLYIIILFQLNGHREITQSNITQKRKRQQPFFFLDLNSDCGAMVSGRSSRNFVGII